MKYTLLESGIDYRLSLEVVTNQDRIQLYALLPTLMGKIHFETLNNNSTLTELIIQVEKRRGYFDMIKSNREFIDEFQLWIALHRATDNSEYSRVKVEGLIDIVIRFEQSEQTVQELRSQLFGPCEEGSQS